MAEEVKPAAEAANEAAAQAPTIALADLQNAVKVMDYAAEQGAFKGWAVIEQVIAVRNRLNAFVEASTPKEPEAPAPQAKKRTPALKKNAKTGTAKTAAAKPAAGKSK